MEKSIIAMLNFFKRLTHVTTVHAYMGTVPPTIPKQETSPLNALVTLVPLAKIVKQVTLNTCTSVVPNKIILNVRLFL